MNKVSNFSNTLLFSSTGELFIDSNLSEKINILLSKEYKNSNDLKISIFNYLIQKFLYEIEKNSLIDVQQRKDLEYLFSDYIENINKQDIFEKFFDENQNDLYDDDFLY